MKLALPCILLFAVHCCFAADKEVSCERIYDADWFSPIGMQKTCYMNIITVIDSPGVLISSSVDLSVSALRIHGNYKIKFLPENTAEKFVNLEVYSAFRCLIESIAKVNFQGLEKLRWLLLGHNRIEKIATDTFDDLVELKELWLDKNKIKFLNGAAFTRLRKLRTVDLDDNFCISGKFDNATSIALLPKALTEKCGFCESPFVEESTRQMSKEVNKVAKVIEITQKEQEQQTTILQTFIVATEFKMESCRSESSKCAAKIAELETELKLVKAQNDDLRNNLDRKNNHIDELQRNNSYLDIELKTSLGKLEIYQGINITKLWDKLNQVLDSQ